MYHFWSFWWYSIKSQICSTLKKLHCFNVLLFLYWLNVKILYFYPVFLFIISAFRFQKNVRLLIHLILITVVTLIEMLVQTVRPVILDMIKHHHWCSILRIRELCFERDACWDRDRNKKKLAAEKEESCDAHGDPTVHRTRL